MHFCVKLNYYKYLYNYICEIYIIIQKKYIANKSLNLKLIPKKDYFI